MIPKSITPELIENDPALYESLRLYVNEHKSRINGKLPADFPIGLHDFLLVVNLDDAIHAGGLWCYLSDVTNDDGTIAEVAEVLAVLRRVHADRIREIVSEALEVWKEFLAIYSPALKLVNRNTSLAEYMKIKKLRDQMERQLDPLDDEFYETRKAFSQVLGEYARKHPDEFVHS